jgi:ankyrin repeat protein
VDAPDSRGGGTPLMNAGAVGSIDAMKLLLEHGAGVNLTSTNGATALMWSVTDIEKVRLLLARGANVNAASNRGRTALHLAARSDASAPVVKLLLAAGADPKATDALKSTALLAATAGNDIETIRLLVDAGIDINAADMAGFTPLITAASNGNLGAVRLLLAKGADVSARSADGAFQKVKAGTIELGSWTPLIAAAAYGSPELIKTLLDAGAQVNVADVRGMTPLMLAVATDLQNGEVVRLLLAKGADPNAKSHAGETAMDWARKIGAPSTIEILRRAGAVETPHVPIAVPAPAHVDLRTSVERSLTLLRSASVVFAANGGCASCHSHNILDIAESAARAKGIAVPVAVDEKSLAQRHGLAKGPMNLPANLLDRFDPPVPELTAYSLIALFSSGYPADRSTDAGVVNLMALQRADGRWASGTIARPPIEDGDIFRTALAIRALSIYGPPGRRAEVNERIVRARGWLGKAKSVTAEDRNMQLLGLHWGQPTNENAPGDRSLVARLVKEVLAQQRSDGGWAQTTHLSSDAYATGQSLFALAETGAVTPEHAAFKKGMAFLLSTQRPDGSWYVSSRSPKFQPYFDGGFPYGHDQWISSMATGWAATALAAALPAR